MAEPPRAELRALTSMRGIAAWLVVLYHIRESIAGLDGWPLAIIAHGYLAVDFFFLLSGFVLWLSYADRLRGGGWRGVGTFWVRRFARIWPLHAFVLTGGVAMALLLALSGRHDPVEFPFVDLPWHYLLVQQWGWADSLEWNAPAWSISVESAAYLLFPLLALAIDWRRVPTPAVLAALVALLVLLVVLLIAREAESLNQTSARLGMIRCLFEVTAGTALCALWSRWRSAPRLPALVCVAVATVALALFVGGVVPEIIAVPVALAAGLLALALGVGRRVLDAAALHWLGEISYATYLGHFLLWKAFKLVFVAAPGPVGWPLIAAYLVLVLVSSAALYRWIERPAQQWINALRPKSRRPSESWGLPR